MCNDAAAVGAALFRGVRAMTYHAPLTDMGFALKYGAALLPALEEGLFGDLAADDVEAVLAEAGRMAGEVIAPLDRIGDQSGATFKDGVVTTAPGWKEAYDAWRKGGWNGVSAPTEWGGQGLPQVLNAACIEMWNAASMAFALGPLVGMAAVDAFTVHGSEELKQAYLKKLVSGEWISTMQLTEPQAGSDVGALRARAERAGDGTYRIKGQKIFITYGEHDLTDNIIHFVLARLPDAPPGTRGISLFLVPKFLLNPDGSLGRRNDVRAHSVEHKLGIHGSPTCTMIFGDQGGATGFIIGEENAGMACMFTMMNRARLAVGLQGVGIAERATQQALAYARERRQGRTTGMPATESAPIIAHPDVKRMLITMRALTQAARTICYATAMALDRAERGPDAAARQAAHARASLLTPLAKAYSTDIGVEVASLGVQVHGGMGFIEETGAAQLYRDARIATIYEGTNGIQAIDLVTRKLPLAGGAAIESFLGELRRIVEAVNATNDPALGWSGVRLEEAVESLARATHWMLDRLDKAADEALAGATPYLRLFGVATGGCLLAQQALAALRLNADAGPRIALARFFAENFAVQAGALERTVVEGAPGVIGADAVLA
jgi:alkylation response protein AidB-like acyl-CoA dehydrogenase